MLINDHLYILGEVYILKSLEIQFNKVSIAKVSLCEFSLSIHNICEFTWYGLQEKKYNYWLFHTILR